MFDEEAKNNLTFQEISDNVTNIDEARVDKLSKHGHMPTMWEEYEILRIKFMYDDLNEPRDIIRFVTLTKYFSEFGPSEAIKLNCKYMLDRYVNKQGL